MTTDTRAERTRQTDLPVDLSTLDPKMLDGLAKAAKKKLSTMRLATFQPYPRQRELIRAGARNKTRLFLAGNRSGKSEICAYEVAVHATGRYPEWWDGRRFGEHAVNG